MKQNQYRIRRIKEGRYEIHRKVMGFVWVHDGGHWVLRGQKVYYMWWYDSLESAKRGVDERHRRDRTMRPIKQKDFYPPFPDKDDFSD